MENDQITKRAKEKKGTEELQKSQKKQLQNENNTYL